MAASDGYFSNLKADAVRCRQLVCWDVNELFPTRRS